MWSIFHPLSLICKLITYHYKTNGWGKSSACVAIECRREFIFSFVRKSKVSNIKIYKRIWSEMFLEGQKNFKTKDTGKLSRNFCHNFLSKYICLTFFITRFRCFRAPYIYMKTFVWYSNSQYNLFFRLWWKIGDTRRCYKSVPSDLYKTPRKCLFFVTAIVPYSYIIKLGINK